MLDILKIQDIHTLQQIKFIYKLLHNNLPHYFKSMTLTNNQINTHSLKGFSTYNNKLFDRCVYMYIIVHCVQLLYM